MQEDLVLRTSIKSYSQMLDEMGLEYSDAHPYWLIGRIAGSQGWMIDLSIMPDALPKCLAKIIPFLVRENVPFSIVKSRPVHIDLNNGFFGNEFLGKAISIYPDTEKDALAMLPLLEEMIGDDGGPNIITDFSVDDNVYVRYGAFFGPNAVDSFGNPVRLIKDGNGELFVDKIPSPAITPPGIANAFADLIGRDDYYEKVRKYFKRDVPSQLNGEFLPWRLIKSNVRGNVYLAITLKYGIPRWWIMKEANHGIMVDAHGRDVRSLIEWQKDITLRLTGIVKVPAIKSSFSIGKQHFLAIEYIRSISVAYAVRDILDNRIWWANKTADRANILRMMLGIIRIVKQLHLHGYIHRDINGTNFLVRKSGEIYMIDMELIYDKNRRQPSPPYNGGTRGFDSPQQVANMEPAETDDIFSLGSTIAYIMTGIEAQYFMTEFRDNLYEKMLFFTGIPAVAALISRATDPEPSNRPGTDEMIAVINGIIGLPVDTERFLKNAVETSQEIGLSLEKGIFTVCSSKMQENNIWFSVKQVSHRNNKFSFGQKILSPGAGTGVAGALYNIARVVRSSDIDEDASNSRPELYPGIIAFIENVNTSIAANWQFLNGQLVNNLTAIPTGLHFGSSGIAMAIAEMIEAGLLPVVDEIVVLVDSCFSRENKLLDVMYGIAGDALALIRCHELFPARQYGETALSLAKRLKEIQHPSGAWLTRLSDDSEPSKFCGFGNGAAGIAYTLLEVGSRLKDQDSLETAIRALKYLKRKAIAKRGGVTWRAKQIKKEVDWSWSSGNAGIALAFLKGYQVTGDKKWLDMVVKALRFIPNQPVLQSISFLNGLTGLGEVYLEVFRVTGDQYWWERARWIAIVLNQMKFKDGDMVWWLVQNPEYLTADLFNGNSGVLHFLNRYLHPDMFTFPLLP